MTHTSSLKILIVALIIGSLLSIVASSFPDGLETVARRLNFTEQHTFKLSGLLSEYRLPLVSSDQLSTFLTGILGVLTVFVLLLFMGKILYRENNSR